MAIKINYLPIWRWWGLDENLLLQDKESCTQLLKQLRKIKQSSSETRISSNNILKKKCWHIQLKCPILRISRRFSTHLKRVMHICHFRRLLLMCANNWKATLKMLLALYSCELFYSSSPSLLLFKDILSLLYYLKKKKSVSSLMSCSALHPGKYSFL